MKTNNWKLSFYVLMIALIIATIYLFININSVFISIATIIFILIFIISSIRPYYGLLLLITLLIALAGKGFINIGDYMFTITEIASFTIFLALLLNQFLNGNFPNFQGLGKIILIFLFFNIPAIIIGILAGNRYFSVFYDISLFVRFIVAGVIAYNVINNRKDYIKSLIFFLLFGTIICLFSLLIYYILKYPTFITEEPYYGLHGRSTATFGNANSFAGFLELILPIIFSLFLWVKNLLKRFLLLAAFFFGLWSMFLTYSRGGYISILFSLSLLLILLRKHITKRILLILVVSFLIFMPYLLKDNSLKRYRDIYTGKTYELELEYGRRGEQYREYLKIITKNILTGIGWGWEQQGYNFRVSKSGKYELSGLNSLYLNFLTKSGILGLLGFFILLGFIIKKLANILIINEKMIEYYITIGIISGFSGFLFHQVFDNLLIWPMGGLVFWFLIGIGMVPLKKSYSK